MLHTADINPSEDDREAIIAYLQNVMKDNESKEKETENILKKGKQKMDDEQVKDLEKEKVHLQRNAKLLEDAMAKCERTSGHTLKKAFNKKLLAAAKSMMTDEKYTAFEALLSRTGIYHAHPVHHYGHHHHHHHHEGSPAPQVEAH